jgi:molecular chaperone GrpE
MSEDMSEDMREEMDEMDDSESVNSTGPAHGSESAETPMGEDSTHEEVVDQVLETRDEEMDRLRETAEKADKRVLMAQAEAENFRKRMRRDYEDQIKYAAMPLVADVLEVRDNLLRAVKAANDSAGSLGLQEGVAMVVKQLDDFLVKHSVRQIPAEGELFDPNFHEAISQMPSEQEAGMVAHVALTGFQMHDRVVRASQVVVSTGPAE